MSVGENSFLNVHVIEQIFKSCTTKQLLSCRLVCKLWKEEATRCLQQRQVWASVRGENSLKDFLHCMENSDNIPFQSLTVEISYEISLALLKQFFQLFHNELKNLRLEYETQPMEVSSGEETWWWYSQDENQGTFRNDANEVYFDKLNSLQLLSTNIFPPKEKNCVPKIFYILKMPKLSSLSVQQLYEMECASLILKYLKDANFKLRSLRLPCNEFPTLANYPGVNLVALQELDICELFHGSFATNETIMSISSACPNLRSLSIEIGFRVKFETVFALFETLKHSLQYLKLIIQDKNLLSRNIHRVNFYFPRLPKLTGLFLRYANPGLVYYVDEMPQLSSLELETPWTRKLRGNIFPGLETKYDNLKTLTLSEKLTSEDVIKINTLFPNLQFLCASFLNDSALMEVYSNMSRLTTLMIDRNSNVTDFGICGVPGDDLEKFNAENLDRDKILQFISETRKDAVGQNLSIVSLSRLNTLKIAQAGLSHKSIVLGVCNMPWLQNLAVQTTVLRTNMEQNLTEDKNVLNYMMQNLQQLKTLSLWRRRNSEKLEAMELAFLRNNCPSLEIHEVMQTICTSST